MELDQILLILSAVVALIVSCVLLSKKRCWETVLMAAGSGIALIGATVNYYYLKKMTPLVDELKSLVTKSERANHFAMIDEYMTLKHYAWQATFAGIAVFVLGLLGYCVVKWSGKK